MFDVSTVFLAGLVVVRRSIMPADELLIPIARAKNRGRRLVATLREHHIEGFPVSIKRAIQIHSYVFGSDIGLVHARQDLLIADLRRWASASILGSNFTAHRLRAAWSTPTPRSAMISSRSRYEKA